MYKYPCLIIHKKRLVNNIQVVRQLCANVGIEVSGVVKGTNGNRDVIQTFIEAGMTELASSRIDQLQTIKELDASVHTLMLRISMLSELEEMVEYADCSLQSELTTLKVLEQVCQRKNKTHEVVLMVDLGDLREGFFSQEELIEAVLFVEKSEYLLLKGIGTNLGCYGSIVPDQQNLGKLVQLGQKIESMIGRSLEWISGGATTSIQLIVKEEMPKGITHLRIGDGIFLRDMELYFDYSIDTLEKQVFELQAEVIELHEKPSYPIGTISVDAFGNAPVYVDKGTMKRALLAMGRQDVGDMTKLLPLEENIEVIGGSSDHTILDVTHYEKELHVGDIVSFNLQYENLLYSFVSDYIHKYMVE